MPPTTDTRQRLVDAAAELFWERGFAATGLSDILESAGARGGSLYHFFPTKDDLLLAVIDHHARVLETTIENTLAAPDDPREKILEFVEFYRRFMQRTAHALGCPLTNLAAEVGDTHPGAGSRIAAFNDRIAGRLAACLRAAEQPELRAQAPALAQAVLGLVQGATLQSRIAKSGEPLAACLVAVRRLMGVQPVVSVVAARSAAFAES